MESNNEKKNEVVEAKVIVEEPKQTSKKKLAAIGVAIAVGTACVTTVALAAIAAFVGKNETDDDDFTFEEVDEES